MRTLVTSVAALGTLLTSAAIAAPVYLTQSRFVLVNVQDEDVREDAADFDTFDGEVTATTSEDFDGFGEARSAQLSHLLATGIDLSGEMSTQASSIGMVGGGQPATAENSLLVTLRLDVAHTYRADLTLGDIGDSRFPPFNFEASLRRGDEVIIEKSFLDSQTRQFSGVLEPGEYTFSYVAQQGSFEDGVAESSFGANLEMAVIPLPPAACVGMTTLGGMWVVGRIRRRRPHAGRAG